MQTSAAPRGRSRATGQSCCAVVLLLTVGLVVACAEPSCTGSTSPIAAGFRRLSQAVKRSKAASAIRRGTNSTTSSNPSKQVCQWDSSSSMCAPTHEAWLSSPGMPSSSYRRAVLMASERDRHCSQHITAAACAEDWQMRCFWQGSVNATNGRCGSSDMEEMLVWSAKGFMTNVSLIPHAMTCAGTPAHSFFACYAFAGKLEACNSIPGCMLMESLGSIKKVCVPKTLQEKTLAELRKLFSHIDTLHPAAYGSCGASCWLMQAKQCANISTKAGCEAVPFCTYDEAAVKRASTSRLITMWDDDGDGEGDGDAAVVGHRVTAAKAVKPRVCRHKSQEFSSSNAMDRAAQAIYKQCKAAGSATACEAVSSSTPAAAGPGAASRAATVDWKTYQPSNTTARCVLHFKAAGW